MMYCQLCKNARGFFFKCRNGSHDIHPMPKKNILRQANIDKMMKIALTQIAVILHMYKNS